MIRYAITDPSFFNTIENKKLYLKSMDDIADFVLFRDKITSTYTKDAKEFIENSKDYNFKKIIHQNIELANTLNADGVHLTSNQFLDIPKAKELSLLTIISTHSIEEIKKAQQLGADIVTFSPIFATPNKGKPKGIAKLKEAIDCCDIKVIALGGIVTKEQIEQITKTNAYGFASIRYFTTFRV